ncbi:hypothetical protein T10_451 [Trichinella papuae]|uniref:Uncharacterized protein n=1 Tax=Trichinella papuae TaxID=268474 RepID=A0A0V1MAU9_9BILA|nr:hypothetical protein T10_451 [Trichinella papuae]
MKFQKSARKINYDEIRCILSSEKICSMLSMLLIKRLLMMEKKRHFEKHRMEACHLFLTFCVEWHKKRARKLFQKA